MRTLYVGGLTQRTSLTALQTKLLEYGELEATRLICRDQRDEHRGFAYVTYRSSQAAKQALEALDGCEFLGGRLRVDVAR